MNLDVIKFILYKDNLNTSTKGHKVKSMKNIKDGISNKNFNYYPYAFLIFPFLIPLSDWKV